MMSKDGRTYAQIVACMKRKTKSHSSRIHFSVQDATCLPYAEETFDAASSISGRMRIRFMELSGFKVFHKWTPQEYLDFLKENGFEITGRKIFDGTLKLTYAEAVRGQG